MAKIKEKQIKKQIELAKSYLNKLSNLNLNEFVYERPAFNLLDKEDYECFISNEDRKNNNIESNPLVGDFWLAFNVESIWFIFPETNFEDMKNTKSVIYKYGLDNENKRRIYNCLFYSNKEMKKLLNQYKGNK